jgi:hypothetical protein
MSEKLLKKHLQLALNRIEERRLNANDVDMSNDTKKPVNKKKVKAQLPEVYFGAPFLKGSDSAIDHDMWQTAQDEQVSNDQDQILRRNLDILMKVL